MRSLHKKTLFSGWLTATFTLILFLLISHSFVGHFGAIVVVIAALIGPSIWFVSCISDMMVETKFYKWLNKDNK